MVIFLVEDSTKSPYEIKETHDRFCEGFDDEKEKNIDCIF